LQEAKYDKIAAKQANCDSRIIVRINERFVLVWLWIENVSNNGFLQPQFL